MGIVTSGGGLAIVTVGGSSMRQVNVVCDGIDVGHAESIDDIDTYIDGFIDDEGKRSRIAFHRADNGGRGRSS
jgi:hypothetical protein